jgi:hypothetical protein
LPKHHVTSFLNKLCHHATEAGEACGPTGAEKLPQKVQEVDAESWNYFYIFDMHYSKNQSLISDSNNARTRLGQLGRARWVTIYLLLKTRVKGNHCGCPTRRPLGAARPPHHLRACHNTSHCISSHWPSRSTSLLPPPRAAP